MAKVNLKKVCESKEALKYLQSVLQEQPVTKRYAGKLTAMIRLYEEMETDLELSGECILEIDMPRLEAIKERDKFLQFYKAVDDV